MRIFIIVLFIDILKDYLGSGGTGDVFVVEKETNKKKKMVMKSIKVGIKGSEEYKKNIKIMETETRIGIKLGGMSEFLVELTEFFTEGSYCYLVMEFCSGGDLQKIFNKKKHLPQKVFFFLF
jgi:serine/threonine protein kinase